MGWPHILGGKATLISAPTGSGKTLAAFLVCIDGLVRKALGGELRHETEILYVSPLKALGNDIQKNLEGPLGEILQLAGERGLLMPTIRTAVRTGDTLAHERRAMLMQPPHILVTTPESLYILLTAAKSREILKTVHTVIVDEIHAMADDKRGAHLALSMERLEHLTGKPLARIGLSATQKPIEMVAEFLTGGAREAPVIVNIGHRREMDLAVEVPASEMGPVASNEMWGEVYDRIATLAQQHRSTLIFVNTRRLAERVAHHLGERLGEDRVAAHHGSLSRKLRLAAEKKLKAGEIRALVATASLELGIDIGASILSARLVRLARSRWPCSAWVVPDTGAGPFRKGEFLRPLAMNCWNARRWFARFGTANWTGSIFPMRRWIFWRNRLWRCARWRIGAKTIYFEWCGKAYPYRNLERAEFDDDRRDALGGNRGAARSLRRLFASRSRERDAAGTTRRAAGGDYQRRRHSGERALHRGGEAGRHRRRHARRGFCGGKPGGRCVSAGKHFVACAARAAFGQRAGRGRAWRGSYRAVLVRGSAGAHDGIVGGSCCPAGTS